MSKQPVPFHEALPEFIRNVPPNGVAFLATIIKNTRIPFDAIPSIEKLWIAKCRELQTGLTLEEHNKLFPHKYYGLAWKIDDPPYFGVPEALREQFRVSVVEDSKRFSQSLIGPVGP